MPPKPKKNPKGCGMTPVVLDKKEEDRITQRRRPTEARCETRKQKREGPGKARKATRKIKRKEKSDEKKRVRSRCGE